MSRRTAASVLQVISADEIGGGQRHLLTLLEWFRADTSFRFHVICRPGGSLATKFANLGLTVDFLELGDFLDLVSVYRLYKRLREGSFQLVHAHLNRACLYTSVAARLARVPIICTAHGLNRPLYYRFADQIIAVSNAVRDHLVGAMPALADRIRVVHNGINLNTDVNGQLVQRFRQQNYIKPGERIVGVMGTLHDNKGQHVALRALKKIPPNYPVRLVLIGSGPAKDKLVQLAKLLSLGTRVLFFPPTEYVNEFLSMCDFVVVPSIQEAFSLVTLEALLLRRPVIASATGGLLEIIEDGKNGQLFPAGDADRLADLIIKGCDDYRRLERMATEGPGLVLSRFSHNRMGHETRALYEDVLRRFEASKA